jgi:integrase
MAYQRGSLKQVKRKSGLTWILRFRVTKADGSRTENTETVGLVQDFPRESDAQKELGRLGILVRINADAPAGRIKFDALAEHYLKADFGADAVRPKSQNTTAITGHIVRDYLIDRWGDEIADDLKPLEIQRWLKSLHADSGLAWTTISKMRGVMSRIYKVGIRHGHATTNPVQYVETRCKSSYRAIVMNPQQTLAILNLLPAALHRMLILTCAATALRSSEILALRWSDVRWSEKRIRISKRWADGKEGRTKTEASDGYVPLHSVLAHHLQDWHRLTPHGKDTDFMFPSLKMEGRVPISSSAFVGDHLRPAAKAAGIRIEDGQRFGLHNLRHSLSNWLVNKAKVEPKTVQGILRHSRIQTTLDLYTQEGGRHRASSCRRSECLGSRRNEGVGWIVGWGFSNACP